MLESDEIKALPKQVQTIAADLAAHKEHCRGFFAEQNKYADIVDGHKKQIDDNKTTAQSFFGDFNKALDRIDAELAKLRKDNDTLKGKVAALEKAVAAAMKK